MFPPRCPSGIGWNASGTRLGCYAVERSKGELAAELYCAVLSLPQASFALHFLVAERNLHGKRRTTPEHWSELNFNSILFD